jgi:hypothetical protein
MLATRVGFIASQASITRRYGQQSRTRGFAGFRGVSRRRRLG